MRLLRYSAGHSWVSPFWLLAAAFLALSIAGATPAWPQSSGPSSTSSAGPSATWQELSNQFDNLLNQHEATLKSLSTRLMTLETGNVQLTSSLKQLSEQNSSLRNYNEQIGQRMQERDQDLAAAYSRIDRLTSQRNKLLITLIALGVLVAGSIVLKIMAPKLF
jgi:septal ring factor EnvC (AmiA/AmiB activator)